MLENFFISLTLNVHNDPCNVSVYATYTRQQNVQKKGYIEKKFLKHPTKK